jgi:S-disulfanyl-L-cysteine oxidoreductase SoxD
MSSWVKAAGAIASAVIVTVASAQTLPGLGRPATPKEIAAWDIDVRPDFKGLPKGSGTVSQGQDLWEAKCAMCHGVFGESNEVFTPLIGGTTANDVKSGRVDRLKDPAYPGRTTMMKVPTVSTLWDYISRAMPWNAPKSLKPDEVYALTAFMLNMAGAVPDSYVLSDTTMADAQSRLPNRNGMTSQHGLWPGRSMGNGSRPDVKAVACMNNCATEPSLASVLPDFARNAHGNLAEQNRAVGAQHGADTSRPAGAAVQTAAAPKAPAAPSVQALLNKHTCSACHGADNKIVGPSWRDVAAKHGGRPDALTYITGKIKAGGVGAWGQIPMPPQALPDDDARMIAQWLIEGARK